MVELWRPQSERFKRVPPWSCGKCTAFCVQSAKHTVRSRIRVAHWKRKPNMQQIITMDGRDDSKSIAWSNQSTSANSAEQKERIRRQMQAIPNKMRTVTSRRGLQGEVPDDSSCRPAKRAATANISCSRNLQITSSSNPCLLSAAMGRTPVDPEVSSDHATDTGPRLDAAVKGDTGPDTSLPLNVNDISTLLFSPVFRTGLSSVCRSYQAEAAAAQRNPSSTCGFDMLRATPHSPLDVAFDEKEPPGASVAAGNSEPELVVETRHRARIVASDNIFTSSGVPKLPLSLHPRESLAAFSAIDLDSCTPWSLDRQAPAMNTETADYQPAANQCDSPIAVLVASRRHLFEDVALTTKACNCKHSQCLKLYCSCFKSGLMCDAMVCKCKSCKNNTLEPGAGEERKLALTTTLSRRVDAFEKRPHKVEGCACKTSK